jgi:hypothetical protein
MFPDKLEKANKMLKTAKLPPKKVGSKQDWKSCDYNSSGFKIRKSRSVVKQYKAAPAAP